MQPCQPTLAGHGGSAARRSSRREAKATRSRAVRRPQGPVRPAVGRVRQCRDRQAPHRRPDRLVRAGTTAGQSATASISMPPSALFVEAAAPAIEQARACTRARSTASSPSRPPESPRPASKRASGRASGLRDDVRRVPVFGLGCAGGVNGLATAARLAAAEPGQPLAVRHRRNLLDLDPPRQRRSRRDRRHRLVRRRRRGGGRRTARRAGIGDDRAARPRNCGPTRCGSWAGDVEDPGPRGRLRPRDPALHRGQSGRGGRRHAAPTRHRAARRSTASAATPAGSR